MSRRRRRHFVQNIFEVDDGDPIEDEISYYQYEYENLYDCDDCSFSDYDYCIEPPAPGEDGIEPPAPGEDETETVQKEVDTLGSFGAIPDYLIVRILSKLDSKKKILELRLLSSFFDSFINSDETWKEAFLNRFSSVAVSTKGGATFLEKYVEVSSIDGHLSASKRREERIHTAKGTASVIHDILVSQKGTIRVVESLYRQTIQKGKKLRREASPWPKTIQGHPSARDVRGPAHVIGYPNGFILYSCFSASDKVVHHAYEADDPITSLRFISGDAFVSGTRNGDLLFYRCNRHRGEFRSVSKVSVEAGDGISFVEVFPVERDALIVSSTYGGSAIILTMDADVRIKNERRVFFAVKANIDKYQTPWDIREEPVIGAALVPGDKEVLFYTENRVVLVRLEGERFLRVVEDSRFFTGRDEKIIKVVCFISGDEKYVKILTDRRVYNVEFAQPLETISKALESPDETNEYRMTHWLFYNHKEKGSTTSLIEFAVGYSESSVVIINTISGRVLRRFDYSKAGVDWVVIHNGMIIIKHSVSHRGASVISFEARKRKRAGHPKKKKMPKGYEDNLREALRIGDDSVNMIRAMEESYNEILKMVIERSMVEK